MLNEEIRESADFAGGDDDTFNDVVQEFSQMVYTHPERLNKKSTILPEDKSTKQYIFDIQIMTVNKRCDQLTIKS